MPSWIHTIFAAIFGIVAAKGFDIYVKKKVARGLVASLLSEVAYNAISVSNWFIAIKFHLNRVDDALWSENAKRGIDMSIRGNATLDTSYIRIIESETILELDPEMPMFMQKYYGNLKRLSDMIGIDCALDLPLTRDRLEYIFSETNHFLVDTIRLFILGWLGMPRKHSISAWLLIIEPMSYIYSLEIMSTTAGWDDCLIKKMQKKVAWITRRIKKHYPLWLEAHSQAVLVTGIFDLTSQSNN